jgi:hypothetical protein
MDVVGYLEEKKPHGRFRCGWEDNITSIFKKIGREGMAGLI